MGACWYMIAFYPKDGINRSGILTENKTQSRKENVAFSNFVNEFSEDDCYVECLLYCNSLLTYRWLSFTIILTQTLLSFQFFQPSRTGGRAESNTQSTEDCHSLKYWILQNYSILSIFLCILLECALLFFSYPPSVPLKGGNTRAAPARWAGGRGEEDGGEGDSVTASFWLSFSSLPSASSVSSPPPAPSPTVLRFIWAWWRKWGISDVIQKRPHLCHVT